MHCFIVASDCDNARMGLLERIGGEIGHPAVSVPTLTSLSADPRFTRATRPLVLVAHGDASPIETPAIVSFADDHHGHAFVVVVADAIAAEGYKALVRTGSAEWVRWADVATELPALGGRPSGSSLEDRTAKILTFLPSKGGVGNTTLVVEAAIHLSAKRKRANQKIAILDLNLQGGTVADALDIEPRFDIAEIAGQPERLDEQLIDIFTSRHSPRLDVFAGPPRLTRPDEVGPQIIFTFLDSIGTLSDAILLDLPPYWLPWTDDLLRGSDAVLVSGAGTVPALRKLSARLAHLKVIGIPEPQVAAIVNQVEVDMFGRVARRGEIERVLTGSRSFFVRRDTAAATEASDVGRPLTELVPGSRVVRDIRQVAEWIGAAVKRPAAAAVPARQGFTA